MKKVKHRENIINNFKKESVYVYECVWYTIGGESVDDFAGASYVEEGDLLGDETLKQLIPQTCNYPLSYRNKIK